MALIAVAVPAHAVTQGPYDSYVSCDATITDTLGTWTQAVRGTLTLTKKSDEANNLAQVVNAYSSNGNGIGNKTVGGNSGVVSWSSVFASNYTFKIHPSASASGNCGGTLPGDGNMPCCTRSTHT